MVILQNITFQVHKKGKQKQLDSKFIIIVLPLRYLAVHMQRLEVSVHVFYFICHNLNCVKLWHFNFPYFKCGALYRSCMLCKWTLKSMWR